FSRPSAETTEGRTFHGGLHGLECQPFRLRRVELCGDCGFGRRYANLSTPPLRSCFMSTGRQLLDQFSARQKPDAYRQEHWQGTFAEYLDIVRQHPDVTRSAHQRIYDMIMSYGTYEVDEGRRDGLLRYKFFD